MHAARSFPTPAIAVLENTARRDQELPAEVRTESNVALEKLHQLYSNRLYRQILSITRNHEDAEDALQDTFMRAFVAFESFQGRSHLLTWLTRIAINSALMVIRRRRRAWSEVSLTPSSETDSDLLQPDLRDSAPTPEEFCDLKQRFERMFRAIERLDPKLRNAIGIQITRECSMKELADTLGVSVGTVKARLHRARKRLTRSCDHKGRTLVSQKRWGSELSAEVGLP